MLTLVGQWQNTRLQEKMSWSDDINLFGLAMCATLGLNQQCHFCVGTSTPMLASWNSQTDLVQVV